MQESGTPFIKSGFARSFIFLGLAHLFDHWLFEVAQSWKE
jgi:hypothetical protein